LFTSVSANFGDLNPNQNETQESRRPSGIINPPKIMNHPSGISRSLKLTSLIIGLSALAYAQSGTTSPSAGSTSANGDTRKHSVDTTSSPVTTPSGASKSDRRFIEKAAQNANTEVEVARLASARATDSALKAFAQQLVTDHEAANAELATLASRKGVTLPSADRETERYDALTKKKVGTEFDEAFAKQMAGDHEDAVSLYEKAAKKSDDPEIATFASKYLPKLEEHRRTAVTLQKALKG